MRRRTRRRASLLLFWLALVLVSVRPIAPAERALSLALSPLRLLAETAAPVRLLRARAVRAADTRLATDLADEEEARREVLGSLVLAASPTAERRVGRRLVPGTVLGRTRSSLDRLIVRVPPGEAVVPGLPVVSGDVYVGRVARLLPGRPGRVEVDLVTGPGVFVGAVRPGEPGRTPDVWMAVGGVDPGSRRDDVTLSLAVHNPSDRDMRTGPVVVQEVLAGAARLPSEVRHGAIANGFRLGELEHASGRALVRPALDYRAGIDQVTVLLPPEDGRPVEALPEELEDEGWLRARALSRGDTSTWRAGLVVAAGEWDGLRAGAALVAGLRLLGRVDRVEPFRATVQLLADPGLSVVCVARVEGDPTPRSLGRLVAAGPDPEGGLAFDWTAALPLVVGDDAGGAPRASGTVRATLYTASGEPGVPRGLVLGTAELPLGTTGLVRIRVEDAADGRDHADLWVRTGEEAR